MTYQLSLGEVALRPRPAPPYQGGQAQGGEVEGQMKIINRALTAGLPFARPSAQRRKSFLVLYFCAFVFFTIACAPVATPAPKPQMISIYTTPATQPWLADVFACAPSEAVVRVANTPTEADLILRLGEPELLATPAYQIDTEEVLVVTHRQSPLQNMTVEQVREIFAGAGDPSVQVWVYAEGEDVQRVFEQAVMQGRSVTSLARLAVSPQQMSDRLVNEPNTVGILPRRWKVGDARSVYTIPEVPVLALVESEPQGAVREVIACLQE